MEQITLQRNLVFDVDSVNPTSARILADNLEVIADSVRFSNLVTQEADEILLQIENAQKALVDVLNRGVDFVNRKCVI